jgi:hypothetical protein
MIEGQSNGLPLEDQDIMFASEVECRDCHEMPDASITRPVPQRCTDCHDKDYADVQREWLAEFAAVRSLVDSLSVRAAALPVSEPRETVLAAIRAHIRTIDADGSRGTHNHFEQMRILEEDVEALRALLSTIG